MALSGGENGRSNVPIVSIDRVRALSDLIESHGTPEQIAAMQQQIAESAGQDRFQIMRILPQFIQALARNVDASSVYGQFRLPGRDQVVHDRRDEADQKTTEHGKSKKEGLSELELKKGELVEAKERNYENYFGDRHVRAPAEENGRTAETIERLLSKFERLVLERFEQGRKVAQESLDGKPTFLTKTEGEWREFFGHFRERMLAKRVSMEEVAEFLFRGLVTKGDKGIVISDMTLKDGRTEKFIRFSVISETISKLASLNPGDVFGVNKLSQTNAELLYLALAAATGQEFPTSPLPAAGKFMSGRAEGEAARELGLTPPIGGQTIEQKAAHLHAKGKRRSLGGLMGDKEAEPDETPYQFIPWWRWGRLRKPKPFNRVTTIFYLALLIMALLGIGVLTYRLLRGF